MNAVKVLLSATLFVIATIGNAQDNKAIPIPDFTNELMLYVDSSNSIIALPVEKGEKSEDASINLSIVYGVLKAPKSPLRLSAGKTYTIVFKHAPNYLSSPNPKDVYKLIRFNVDEKKKYRSCTIRYTAQGDKANKKGQAALNPVIDTPYKVIGDNIYTITVSGLEPGEYVFPISEYKMYTFGVD